MDINNELVDILMQIQDLQINGHLSESINNRTRRRNLNNSKNSPVDNQARKLI